MVQITKNPGSYRHNRAPFMVSRRSARAILLGILGVLAPLLLVACSGSVGVKTLNDGTRIIEHPSPSPSWISRNAPVLANAVYEFMGVSDMAGSEPMARESALTNAIGQYLIYTGADVEIFNAFFKEEKNVESVLLLNSDSDRARIHIEPKYQKKLGKLSDWYTYERRRPAGTREIEARVLLRIPKTEVDAVKKYAKQVNLTRIAPVLVRYRDLMKRLREFESLADEGQLVRAHLLVDQIEKEFEAIRSMPYFEMAIPELKRSPSYQYPLDRTPLMVALVQGIEVQQVSNGNRKPLSDGLELKIKVTRFGKPLAAVPMAAALAGGREVLSYTDDKGYALFELPPAKTRGRFPIDVNVDLPELKIEETFHVKPQGWLPKSILGIDWYQGHIQAKGIASVARKEFYSRRQGEQLALRAAELEAFRQISTLMTCAQVAQYIGANSDQLYRSLVENEVQSTLHNAETVYTKVVWMNESPVAEAIVRAPLEINAVINQECTL